MSDYPYAPDEFDEYDLRPTPVGVHRAPASTWSRLWPFLLVMALCATVALVAVWLWVRPHGEDVADPVDTPGVAQTEDPTDVVEPEPTEPEGETGPEPGSLEALLQGANLGAVVRVLNDSGPSGEAARGTAALTSHGFTAVTAANYPGDSQLSASSVWYQGGEYRDTALAVAKVLGIAEDRVTEHSLPQGNINVVIINALQIN